MNRTSRILVITVITFAIYFILDELFFSDMRKSINSSINQMGISHNISYLISGIPLFIGVLLIHKPKDFISSLGLNGSIKKGILFPVLCTLPMLIGYALIFVINTNLTLTNVLISGVAAALFEEVFFRGFLFGQLYRYTKLGFIPSIILGALLFASVHLYQSQDFMTLIGIFLTTFLGAILFAWIYVEWHYNLWVPIFLHFFMNLFWMLFAADDNALGGVYANVFRIVTIVLVILLTIIYKRKKALKLEVNKNTIWMKPSNRT